MKYVTVIIASANIPALSYSVPKTMEVEIGDIVIIELRNKKTTGIIWAIEISSVQKNFLCKEISQKTQFKIDQYLISLLTTASKYYITTLSNLVKLSLPINFTQLINYDNWQIDQTLQEGALELSKYQKSVFTQIQKLTGITLFKGVVASGKTEVFLKLAFEKAIKGIQVLIMVPEISLSEHIIDKIKKRFNYTATIWHSSVTTATKKKTFSV